jgi:putative endonuclease
MSIESELGKRGEKLASEHLVSHGYRIVKRNYKFNKAEVDIVAEKNNRMVFVEVKTRKSLFLSEPEFTIPMKKQRQIIKAADGYLKEHDIDLESRFDIITVILNEETNRIDHLEGAFYPTL